MNHLEELEDFLIKNSKVDKQFIRDFFGFQKKSLYQEYEPFTISLEDVAYWLETKKSDLKETLNKNYSKIIDFKIIKNFAPGHPGTKKTETRGGHNIELILLTGETFKMLCMRSKTKKADKVRYYYIELEKLIDEYKNVIINSQQQKIKILEQDIKKQDLPENGMCYIFKDIDELGEIYYRIGRSANLQKRFASHNSSSIHKKIVVQKIKTNDLVHYEKSLRAILYRYTYRNDFFKISENKLANAIKMADKIVKEYKNIDILSGGKNNKLIKSHKMDESLIKIHDDLKIMFSEMCGCVMWNIFDNPKDAYYNGKKITVNKLNKIIMPKTISNKIIIIPCNRDSEYYEYIDVGKDNISYQKLFEILYNHYNQKVSLDFLKKLPNDYWNYIKDSIKYLKKNNKNIVKKVDIMGSLCRFEDVRLIDNYNFCYELILGT